MSQATQIGIDNAKTAVDQVGEFESERACWDSYLANAGDTAIEEGLGHEGWNEAQTVFIAEYTKLTGIKR